MPLTLEGHVAPVDMEIVAILCINFRYCVPKWNMYQQTTCTKNIHLPVISIILDLHNVVVGKISNIPQMLVEASLKTNLSPENQWLVQMYEPY